ncbi:hypothetical protein [Paenibacillus mendelii]|uniref:Uncharacterized protein n=1 Tax=Paenibacillus mendelii TaxID=206163 RepID=A0ABV6JI24_9BACL|nr:hypothetical protein [Paenibacillus mendelii]
MFQPGDHIEIYVKCSLEECEKRDRRQIRHPRQSGSDHRYGAHDGRPVAGLPIGLPGGAELPRKLLLFLVPLLAGRYRLFRGFGYACTPA